MRIAPNANCQQVLVLAPWLVHMSTLQEQAKEENRVGTGQPRFATKMAIKTEAVIVSQQTDIHLMASFPGQPE